MNKKYKDKIGKCTKCNKTTLIVYRDNRRKLCRNCYSEEKYFYQDENQPEQASCGNAQRKDIFGGFDKK